MATDPTQGCCYNRNMLKRKEKKPVAAINRWVADAVKYWGLSQSALAHELYLRRVIQSDDRSIVNKIVLGRRDVTADEAFAIAEITGLAAPNDLAAIQRVPLVSWISAGALMNEHLSDEQLGSIEAAGLEPGDWIALRVKGDSMDRISPPDSIIFVDRRDKRLVPNACYVIADLDGDATYKRYRPDPARFEPVSTNTSLEPIFPDHDPVVVGRVKRSMIDM